VPGHTHTGSESAEAQQPADWEIPVLLTVARTGEGVAALAEAIERHRAWGKDTGELARRRRMRLEERVREQVERALRRLVWVDGGGAGALERALPGLERGEESPYDVAARIVGTVASDPSAPRS
jgi:LAO/AO transport system kinase